MKNTRALFLFVCLFGFASAVRSQPEDLDALTRELDLSILEPTPTPLPEKEAGPGREIFRGFDSLRLPAAGKNVIRQEKEGVLRITLPESLYLVAPNPADLEQTYENIETALAERNLNVRPPLKLVLHADGNFSAALALEGTSPGDLPSGLDLSPRPATRYAALAADIRILRKDQASVLEAYLQLKERAENQGIDLDTREFFFFPESPGRVYFALRIKTDGPAGKKPEQP